MVECIQLMRFFCVSGPSVCNLRDRDDVGKESSIHMGVDHGETGDKSPEFGVGDVNVNCPPQIFSYRYKKERSVALKMRQNPFSARALPRTPLREHMMLSDSLR